MILFSNIILNFEEEILRKSKVIANIKFGDGQTDQRTDKAVPMYRLFFERATQSHCAGIGKSQLTTNSNWCKLPSSQEVNLVLLHSVVYHSVVSGVITLSCSSFSRVRCYYTLLFIIQSCQVLLHSVVHHSVVSGVITLCCSSFNHVRCCALNYKYSWIVMCLEQYHMALFCYMKWWELICNEKTKENLINKLCL